jgi:hypothetical protein
MANDNEQTSLPPLKPPFEVEFPDDGVELDERSARYETGQASIAMVRTGEVAVEHEVEIESVGDDTKTAVRPGSSPYVDSTGRSSRKPAPQSKRSRPLSAHERRIADKKPPSYFEQG